MRRYLEEEFADLKDDLDDPNPPTPSPGKEVRCDDKSLI